MHKTYSPPEIDSEFGKRERNWSLPVILAHTKHNSQSKINNGLGTKEERHWSLPIVHAHTQNTTHILKMMMEEKGRSIGYFQ